MDKYDVYIAYRDIEKMYLSSVWDNDKVERHILTLVGYNKKSMVITFQSRHEALMYVNRFLKKTKGER